MLTRVAEGVLVHESEFLQSNAVVVHGPTGVLLIDAGLQEHELACLASDLEEKVVAGFSTHADWDHLLWHARLGDAPRYGTARCASAVENDAEAKAAVVEHLAETEVAGQVPLDFYGEITGLPAGTTHVPWAGPRVRIIEHQGHAPGHAALLVEERRVLVAGDMLSDVLIPMLDIDSADPIGDYLTALQKLEAVSGEVDVVIPGHGSVGGAGEVQERIKADRAYVEALRDGKTPGDPRIGPAAKPGWEWVSFIHEGQVQRRAGSGGTTQ